MGDKYGTFLLQALRHHLSIRFTRISQELSLADGSAILDERQTLVSETTKGFFTKTEFTQKLGLNTKGVREYSSKESRTFPCEIFLDFLNTGSHLVVLQVIP